MLTTMAMATTKATRNDDYDTDFNGHADEDFRVGANNHCGPTIGRGPPTTISQKKYFTCFGKCGDEVDFDGCNDKSHA